MALSGGVPPWGLFELLFFSSFFFAFLLAELKLYQKSVEKTTAIIAIDRLQRADLDQLMHSKSAHLALGEAFLQSLG
jgi:hypothetical protein